MSFKKESRSKNKQTLGLFESIQPLEILDERISKRKTPAKKENHGSVSTKSSAKRKLSAKPINKPAASSEDIFDDGIELKYDDEFYGFTTDDINKCTSLGN